MKYQLFFKKLLLGFIILTPINLLLLPANTFDKGQSICISQLLAGKECFACGLTRGIMHLIHFDFEEAFAYNILSFIVLPLLSSLSDQMRRNSSYNGGIAQRSFLQNGFLKRKLCSTGNILFSG